MQKSMRRKNKVMDCSIKGLTFHHRFDLAILSRAEPSPDSRLCAPPPLRRSASSRCPLSVRRGGKVIDIERLRRGKGSDEER